MNTRFYLALSITIMILLGVAIGYSSVYAQCTPDGTAGDDSITCTGTDADGVDGGAGNDTITVNGGATVQDTVGGGDNDDTLTNNGSIDAFVGMDGGNGDDTLTNNGDIDAFIGMNDDAGENTMTNNGDIDAIVGMYGGNDSDTMTNNGDIDAVAGMDGYEGDDTMVNNGSINVDFDGMYGDEGNDTMTNNGSIASTYGNGMNGSDDDDTIINNGSVVAGDDGLDAGSGDDTIVNNGSVVSTDDEGIDGDSGNDTIINNGSVVSLTSSAIKGDDGDDTIIVRAGSTVNGATVDIDGGNDTDSLGFRYDFYADSEYVPTEYTEFMAAIAGARTTGCPCTITFTYDGREYTYTYDNIEQLRSFYRFIQTQARSKPELICDNGLIKVFRLPRDEDFEANISVYGGFSPAMEDGFFVGQADNGRPGTYGENAYGWQFSIAATDNGRITVIKGDGTTVVTDCHTH